MAVINQVLLPSGRRAHLAAQCWCVVCLVELITKLLSAYAVLLAVEEGTLDWDQPAGPPVATVRHLIAHASGLAFDSGEIWAAPGTKRIYSNTGFAVLADAVAAASGIRFADYLAEGAFGPPPAARLPG